ncbi:hypothetical protein VM1G_05239 [Cytospora mali]|uniref:Uncharacterized protein n=1 Tax=Cytospora mali TaxID=578113 RepID=A0A194W0Z3_CYTMA|nr:hypothetical protein VM1G_05239 [Valsa mali]
MCTQINVVFTCGHRAFNRFDNCPRFGKSCLGAGANHKDVRVDRMCNDCKFRESQANTPDGWSPDSNGEGGGGSEKKADPWWDNDPRRGEEEEEEEEGLGKREKRDVV